MTNSRITLVLYALGALLLTLACCALLWFRPYAPPPRVAGLDQVRDVARTHGLQLHSGGRNAAPLWAHHNYITRGPRTTEQLGGCRKDQCGLTPAWRGVVWVYDLRSPAELDLRSIKGHQRQWGTVLAVGDPELLDELEALLQRPK